MALNKASISSDTGPYLSIVIPAYNASTSIERALNSIFANISSENLGALEVIVVDDGGVDGDETVAICLSYPKINISRHITNQGMCAARNTGIRMSAGKYVTLLDADDEFVTHWWEAFHRIIHEWPEGVNVCYSPCVTHEGQQTCSDPGYRGLLTAADMVLEKLSGEYNPIFLGEYIRKFGYYDIGTRKSCGILSYLRMAREHPFWITSETIRQYNIGISQSVSWGWTTPIKARETLLCFNKVKLDQGDFIYKVSPRKYNSLCCKIFIYELLADQGRNFKGLWAERKLTKYWLASLMFLIIGRQLTSYALRLAKRFSIIRQYG